MSPSRPVLVLAGLTVACLLAGWAAVAVRTPGPDADGSLRPAVDPSASASPEVPEPQPDDARPDGAQPNEEPLVPVRCAGDGCARWGPVLRHLDGIRARAYATGDARRLARVHEAGSLLLQRDRSTLAAWTARAAQLRGLRRALLEVSVLSRGPGSVRLRVVDRVGPAVAVLDSGRRLELPRDRSTVRVLTLRRAPGAAGSPQGWRFAGSRTP